MIPVAECICCGARTMLHADHRATRIRCWRCSHQGLGGREPCCDRRMTLVATNVASGEADDLSSAVGQEAFLPEMGELALKVAAESKED